MTTISELTIDQLAQMHARVCADVAALLTPDVDLRRSTPCADWDVGALLAHQIGQNRGFTRAVSTGTSEPKDFAPVKYSADVWTESVRALTDAFAAATASELVVLAEFGPDPLPVTFAVAAQLLDIAVHGWDLARGLGTDYEPAPDIVDAVAQIATVVPDGQARLADDAQFAPVVESATVGTWAEALARLGRDPQWGS
ncbi:TIGR03086 family protein [Gordonia sp. TBRC 11910]|uniref:TIGR03086 family protein n=1 Tax=Gordonia asplenii TaxID=2725283 RepID=A0A848KP41_9ACTN|nr:TIGR03086 family metal-binding protein [Gordonia asplenii]NMN99676.1 TIGR03086 family protein [Gordonia asplenii]